MKGYTLTKVFRVDGHLVVANNIEEAAKLYRLYMDDEWIDIKHIELIFGDACNLSSSAIISKKEDE